MILLILMVDSVICIIDFIFVVVYVLFVKEKCKINCLEDYYFFEFIKNVNFISFSGNYISFNS